MFDELFTSSKAAARYSGCPLLAERIGYLAHCAAQGSTRSSLRLTAQHQLIFIEVVIYLTQVDARPAACAAMAPVVGGPPPFQPATDTAGGCRRGAAPARWRP